MNYFSTSNGDRISKEQIDRNIKFAKQTKRSIQLDEDGYYHCENPECENPNLAPFDCSHNISVKKCQEMSKSELAWKLSNITILCRTCHQIRDQLTLFK